MEKLESLKKQVSAARATRIEDVLSKRVKNVQLVFENLHDPNNGAACLRTAEAMGIQHVHAIEGYGPFDFSPKVTQGAHKWLSIHRYPTTSLCVRTLKSQGFQLYAADLADDSVAIDKLSFDGPVALIFGNEHRGVSNMLRRQVDGRFILPLAGFSQSYNLSVSCAIALYHLRLAGHLGGDLSSEEKDALYLQWLRMEVKGAEGILAKSVGLPRRFEDGSP